MKNLISKGTMMLILFASLFPFNISAQTFWGDTIYTEIEDEETNFLVLQYSITSTTSNTVSVIGKATRPNQRTFIVTRIPETVEWKGQVFTVTEIGPKAFIPENESNTFLIEDLYIPKSIKKIGSKAFEHTRVYNLHIEDTEAWSRIELADIYAHPLNSSNEQNGLYLNDELIDVFRLPDDMDYVNDFIFHKCRKLKKVSSKKPIKKVGSHSFDSCNKLESINMALTGLDYIGTAGFKNCGNLDLSKLHINDPIIRYEAFSGCNFKSIAVLHLDVDTVYQMAFYHDTQDLSTVIIEEGVHLMGSSFTGQWINIFVNKNKIPSFMPPLYGIITGGWGYSEMYGHIQVCYVPDESIEAYKKHDSWGPFTKEFRPLSSWEPSGIDNIEIDECVNDPVVYYNMQGVKVDNPQNGIFIKKQGAKTTKVLM